MITPEQKLHLEEEVVRMLRTVFDPEIPVDIYSLGLIDNRHDSDRSQLSGG